MSQATFLATTAAGLRAGVPSTALPGLLDQHHHARRLHQLGVSPAPLTLARVNPVRLAGPLRELTGGDYADRPVAVGESVRALDGAELTASILAGLVE